MKNPEHSALAGVDIIECGRFKQFAHDPRHPFIVKVFTQQEIQYIFSYSDPIPHLSGFFAAKESVSKALGVAKYPFVEVEVRHDVWGRPEAFHKGEKLPVALSISHTQHHACAIAVCFLS